MVDMESIVSRCDVKTGVFWKLQFLRTSQPLHVTSVRAYKLTLDA